MPDDSQILKNLANRVDQVLGDGPSEERRRIQKDDLLSMVASARRPRGRTRYWVAAAAVFCGVIIGAFLILTSANERPFWVGHELTQGVAGVLIEAPEKAQLPIKFEGGSTMELSGRSTARVISSNREKVLVALKRGRLDARIENNGKTYWQVAAGPYQVKVKGTIFSVDWDEQSQGLDVAVKRGVVVVGGDGLDESGIRLAAGNRLQIRNGKALVFLDTENKEESPRDTVRVTKVVEIAEPIPELELPPDSDAETIAVFGKQGKPSARRFLKKKPSTVKSAADNLLTEKWKEHYEQKNFRAAIDAAENIGLEKLANTLGEQDLWLLAKAARYAGRGAVTTKLLLRFKSRFESSERAKTASFLLGRVALEQNGNPYEARKWFRTYLDERAGGPLAEEALGRLIESCVQLGALPEARRVADLYLERYPDGSFAELAGSLR